MEFSYGHTRDGNFLSEFVAGDEDFVCQSCFGSSCYDITRFNFETSLERRMG